MHVPPFNIPNLRVEQRKTSSAEDMARKNSTGSGDTDELTIVNFNILDSLKSNIVWCRFVVVWRLASVIG